MEIKGYGEGWKQERSTRAAHGEQERRDWPLRLEQDGFEKPEDDLQTDDQAM